MTVSRHVLRGFLAMVVIVSVLQYNSAATDDDDDDAAADYPTTLRSPTPSPSLMDRVSGVMGSVKQQAGETLDGAGNAATLLNRLHPKNGAKGPEGTGGSVGGGRNTENRLVGDDVLGKFQETKGRTVAAAKKVVDETIYKLQSTVDDIKRTVSGDDQEDAGGDRRISNALDSLLRAVGSEGKAAFEYASDVINETADRAKAAVEKAERQKQRRPQH